MKIVYNVVVGFGSVLFLKKESIIMARRRKRKHTSDREFIKVNLELKDGRIADIAKRLGMQDTSVLQRRCKINKKFKGLLPALPRGRTSKKVDLRALAAEVQAELDRPAL